jgi:hypothetical protein
VSGLRRPGPDQPGTDPEAFEFAGDLTALAEGRLVLLSDDREAHDLDGVLASLVGEEPDRAPGTL